MRSIGAVTIWTMERPNPFTSSMASSTNVVVRWETRVVIRVASGLSLGLNLNIVQVSRANLSMVQEESLRDRKKTLRRHLMIEIARGLIAANGLRSLKVRDVAEAAD